MRRYTTPGTSASSYWANKTFANTRAFYECPITHLFAGAAATQPRTLGAHLFLAKASVLTIKHKREACRCFLLYWRFTIHIYELRACEIYAASIYFAIYHHSIRLWQRRTGAPLPKKCNRSFTSRGDPRLRRCRQCDGIARVCGRFQRVMIAWPRQPY